MKCPLKEGIDCKVTPRLIAESHCDICNIAMIVVLVPELDVDSFVVTDRGALKNCKLQVAKLLNTPRHNPTQSNRPIQGVGFELAKKNLDSESKFLGKGWTSVGLGGDASA